MRKSHPRGEQAKKIAARVRREARNTDCSASKMDADLPRRPTHRGECLEARGVDDFGAPNPCPFVSCRYHLYLDVREQAGGIAYGYPDVPPEELDRLPATCALDVADEGPRTLEEVAQLFGVTRERIRQVQAIAARKYRLQLLPLVEPEEARLLRIALARNTPIDVIDNVTTYTDDGETDDNT